MLRAFWKRRPGRVIAVAVLVLFIGTLRYATPCGCFGITVLRPAVSSVAQVPEFCAIQSVPDQWLDGTGKRLDPLWPEAEQKMVDLEEGPNRVRYEIRRGPRGLLVGLAHATLPIRSQNHFRQEGNKLVDARAGEWESSTVVPLMLKHPFPDFASVEMSPFGRSASGLLPGRDDQYSVGHRLGAAHSYTGPSVEPFLPSADFFAPRVIQRPGFVDFYGEDYPLPPIPRRPIEYTFCGRENWMTRAAGWHGPHVYTFPLSLDARAFVLCDFSKRNISK